jgi:RNA polymerase sigma factor (sigma-70 family)
LKNEEESLDAAQDVFLRVLTGVSKRQRCELSSSFFYTAATNVCLNRLRRGNISKRLFGRETVFESDDGESAVDITGAIDRGFEAAEARIILENIFATEAAETQALCYFYFVDGMTLQECANVYSISVSGAKKRLDKFLKRARLKLKIGG